VILFTLCVFFSLSHYEVKYGIKYLTRGIKNSKEKIEESYGGISSRLKSQLLLCVFIGVTSYLALRILELIGFPLPQKGVLALLAGLFEIIPYL
jgi:predicted PurR-regulated permease PerM